jgi:hypothetical protein
MGLFKDIPELALQHVIRLARGRQILGTNKYARVCRRWLEASSSEDAEQLQLYVNCLFMPGDDFNRAYNWLDMHGSQVEVLVVGGNIGCPSSGDKLQQLSSTAGFRCLRRLDMQQYGSLPLVVPVLANLPHLRHLAAHVGMQDVNRQRWKENAVGGFMDHDLGAWEEVPDLQQLCPQLVNLDLAIGDWENGDVLQVDARLPRLLPAGLRQLTLVGPRFADTMIVPSTSLVHLTALHQLTLERAGVRTLGAAPLPEGPPPLPQLRQLRGYHHPADADEDAFMEQLAHTVVDYTACDMQQVAAATRFGQLTRLVSSISFQRPPPDASAEAFGAITSIQELWLLNNSLVADAVHQAAGLAQVRRLYLGCYNVDPVRLGPSLGQCTQVTSLVLLVKAYDGEPLGPLASALQHLTGLRCLTVTAELLEQEAGAWLAPLTALTRLGVQLSEAVHAPCYDAPWQQKQQWAAAHRAKAQRLLEEVQVWPASCQQVVFWVCTFGLCGVMTQHWHYTPAAADSSRIVVWLEEVDITDPRGERSILPHRAPRWCRPLKPSPHLRHVWELQGADDNPA